MMIKRLISVPLVCTGIVFAGTAVAASVIHNEADGTSRIIPSHDVSNKSRAQVKQELEEFRRNPISADGQYRYVGGDQLWELIPHKIARRDGKWQHVDTLPHDTPRPNVQLSLDERRARDAIYQP